MVAAVAAVVFVVCCGSRTERPRQTDMHVLKTSIQVKRWGVLGEKITRRVDRFYFELYQ